MLKNVALTPTLYKRGKRCMLKKFVMGKTNQELKAHITLSSIHLTKEM